MDYLEDDDIHFCLRCRQTILGLDAYVAHRSQRNCQPESVTNTENRNSEPVASSSNNDSISQLIAISESPGNMLKTAEGPQGQHGALNSDADPRLLDSNFDADPSLKADDFFSLLELQSSTKSGNSCVTAMVDSSWTEPKSRSVEKGPGMVTRSKSGRVVRKPKEKYDNSQKVRKKKERKVGKRNAMQKSRDYNAEIEVVQKTSKEVLDTESVENRVSSVESKENGQEKTGINEEEEKITEKVFPELFSDLPHTDTSYSFSTLAPIEEVIPFTCEEVVGQEEYEVEGDDDEEEEEEVDAPPRSYGGKWKPGSSPSIYQQRSVSLASVSWTDQEATSSQMSSSGSLWRGETSTSSDLRMKPSVTQKHHSMPPPGHTRGKWLPSSNDPFTVRRTGHRVQYWCGVCNRRLASRGLYERHLMSPLHAKRTRQERQLDEDLHASSRRPRRLSRKLQEAIASRMVVGGVKATVKQAGKKNRKSIVCEICGSQVPRHQMGKHLVSRFHCRRAVGHPAAQSMVAAYATAVAREAPFRCGMCRFYCNSLHEFVHHWDSKMHTYRDTEIAGRYWCSICKYIDDTSAGMRVHLLTKQHQEVISVINNSFPIEIQKLVTLKCDEPSCERIFRFNSQLRQHSQLTGHKQSSGSASDSYQDRIECNRCSFVAHSGKRLQRHMLVRHNIRNYFCSDCGLKFGAKEDVLVHRRSEAHKYTVLRKRKAPQQLVRYCPYCFEVKSDMLVLKEHLAQIHPDKAHRCVKCGESFTLKQELSRHVRSSCRGLPEDSASINDVTVGLTIPDATPEASGGSSGSRCPICSFTSSSESELLYHIALHGEPISSSEPGTEGPKREVPKYVCPSCPRVIRKDCLRNHLKTHTGERSHICTDCKISFARADVLSKHRQLVHFPEIRCRCRLCGVKYSSASSLRRHLQSHQDGRQKDYHCSECGLDFFHKTALKQHMQTHSGKNVKCYFPDCVYSCRSAAELDYHVSTHSDLRSFKCDQCDYGAKTKYQLTRHLKTHRGVDGKEYHCSECDFKGSNATHLKRHSRVHSGAKPYHCPHCSYTCNLQENLRKHVLSTKLHPGKYLYFCQEAKCSFQSNSAKDFRVHLVQEHEKEPSVATSLITGLYKFSEDITTPRLTSSNSKPRDTLQSQSSSTTSSVLPSPLLGSAGPLSNPLQDDPSLPATLLVTSSSETMDDIIFIQLPPADELGDGDAAYDTDVSFFSSNDHQLFFESLPPPTSHAHAHVQDAEVGVEQEFVIIDESPSS